MEGGFVGDEIVKSRLEPGLASLSLLRRVSQRSSN